MDDAAQGRFFSFCFSKLESIPGVPPEIPDPTPKFATPTRPLGTQRSGVKTSWNHSQLQANSLIFCGCTLESALGKV